MTEDTVKMTHDEIIDILKGLVFGTFDRTTAKEREALDMAIMLLEQEPCEDTISRADAIRIAEQGQVHGFPWEFEKLTLLPSVYPKVKVGKWIECKDRYDIWYKCSECEKEYDKHYIGHIKYCSNCGAKMEIKE